MKNALMIAFCFAEYEIEKPKIWFCPQTMYSFYVSDIFRLGNSEKLLVFGYSLM